MPDLNTRLHVDMLEGSKRTSNVLLRVIKAAKRELLYGGIYGLQWGDPDFVEPLRFVKDKYLLPYVNAEPTAVEIGPGGGRWTRYMMGFKKLYVVDYYADLLSETRRRIKKGDVEFIKNGGTDFPSIS